ncbi:MAG: acyltransferase, partial [Georgfuchsia sp.]
MVISTLPGTTPMQFMYRRFIRVVPLYWLATGAALAYFYARYDRFPTVDHWLTSLLFLPPPSPHPLPILYPGWTLNFEMAFYSIIAVSLLAGRRAFVVAALVTMSAAALAVKTGYNAVDWYLNPRLAEFSAGLLIGIMLRRGMHIDRSYGSLLLLSGSTVLLLNSRSVPAIPILHWGLPTVAVLLGALAFEQSRIVRSRIAQVLGDASYSIYLAHPFVIWFAEWGLGPTRHPVYGW